MRLNGIDFIELYVNDVDEVVRAYSTLFGFQPIARSGPETGLEGRRSVAMALGTMRLLVTSPVDTTGPIAEHVACHGDGVRDIAFEVDDVRGAFNEAVERGARPILKPTVWEGMGCQMVKATIGGFGSVVHSFVQWAGQRRVPIAAPHQPIDAPPPPPIFTALDHVAMCLDTGTLDATVAFYRDVLGFVETQEVYVETDASGMNSKVVQSPDGRIKFPLQEPLPGVARGPIAEFLVSNRGPGVYHLALLTDDIIEALLWLRERGIAALPTPKAYYEMLPERVGRIDEDVAALRELHILVDRDPSGYLLQVFTRSLHSRKTLFFEVIQRRGSEGFGGANVRALFKAIERESAQSPTA